MPSCRASRLFWAALLSILYIFTFSSCQSNEIEGITSTGTPTLAQFSTSTAPSPAETTPVFDPTPTAAPTALPVVRFAVIGDYGQAGDELAAVAALIESWQVDFIITTGDNNYPSGSAATIDENIGQYFHSYIYPYTGEHGLGAETNRFFPSLGNHDWYSSKAQPYLDYFELPGNERYYTFRWGFVDFFVLDSDWSEPDGINRESVQADWLREALAASEMPWKVVYFHLAPFSSGLHGPTTHMRWPFKEWGADVVLAGHDHHYERLEVDGMLYFVNGLGGGARYVIFTPAEGSQFRYNARHGAMLVEASPEEIEFSFINVDGDEIDTYVLHRVE